jgi:hypothetical protein
MVNAIFAATAFACMAASPLAEAAFSAADYAPTGVGCQDASRCGLYMDISGSASVNFAGSDSFSYQPAYTYGAYRYVTDEASATATGGISSTQVQSSNFATFGALKASQSSGSSSDGSQEVYPYLPHAGSNSWSNIGFQDRLTFLADPSLTNTMGTMVGRVQVSGGVSASPATYPLESSSASAAVTVPGTGGTYSVAAYGDRPGTGGIPTYITFELPVRFNATDFTSLAMWLQTSANTGLLYGFGISHAVTATSDFFSTLEWVGIDSVRDAQGNLVSGWSVASASGFDYSRSYASQIAAVPEPETYAMMLAGLGLVGWAVRRRKRAAA